MKYNSVAVDMKVYGFLNACDLGNSRGGLEVQCCREV